MKMLIREVEGDGCVPARKRLLSFKEFCQYDYEPSRSIRNLNITNEQRLELNRIIEERKFTPVI
jgi:hypothetical protein